MSKKKIPRLTPLETLIMDVLWEKAPIGVSQVREKLQASKPMAYNTISTVMRILRDKGVLQSERVGRFDIYSPKVSREQIGKHTLGEVIEAFFYNSPRTLVSQLIDTNRISAADLQMIKDEISQKLGEKKQGGGNDRSK